MKFPYLLRYDGVHREDAHMAKTRKKTTGIGAPLGFAERLRGHMDADESKHVVVGLEFFR
jgi:hypothetical protein